jgi:pyruvate kinase
MQKYIAVVNPRMDEDDIARLIRKGIAGAIFEISHQNYPVAMRLIDLVQKLAKKNNRPISIIQDVSNMQDPLDLEVGLRAGVHWVATSQPEHVKLVRGLNKLAGVIYKNRNLPKGVLIDSVMSSDFLDPDAEIYGQSQGQIKHLVTDHKNQKLLDALLHLAQESHTKALAVSDLELAKSISQRRPMQKIIFVAGNDAEASKGSLYWGVHPMYPTSDTQSAIRNSHLVKKGERILDATRGKHVTIHLV